MLQQYLQHRSDLGFWNAVAIRIMAPQCSFEPDAARKPQLWFVLSSIVSVAAVIAFVYFNLWN